MSEQNIEKATTSTTNQNEEQQQQANKIGDYLVKETLGEGAFGKVKLAIHIPTNEKVAIKILNKKRMLELSGDITKIQKEINILKKMRHKNIIQLYEILESRNNLFLVMEFCPKGELFDYIVKKKRLNEVTACKFFQNLIDGIEYLHSQKIVHRDLKPENLLLDERGNLKLSDFGLSTCYQGKIMTPCGTPSYAPPEMLRGEPYVGVKSDVWSCGIILFAMLCGFLPFAESKEEIIIEKVVNSDYKIPDFLSNNAKDMLNKLMEIDPEKRVGIKQIKEHPWFRIVEPVLRPGIVIGINQIPVDESILNKVLELNSVKSCYINNNNKYSKEKEEKENNTLNNNVSTNIEPSPEAIGEGFIFKDKIQIKQYIKKKIQDNKFENFTACYYLILKKHINNGGVSVSDLYSKLFLNFISNPNNLIDVSGIIYAEQAVKGDSKMKFSPKRMKSPTKQTDLLTVKTTTSSKIKNSVSSSKNGKETNNSYGNNKNENRNEKEKKTSFNPAIIEEKESRFSNNDKDNKEKSALKNKKIDIEIGGFNDKSNLNSPKATTTANTVNTENKSGKNKSYITNSNTKTKKKVSVNLDIKMNTLNIKNKENKSGKEIKETNKTTRITNTNNTNNSNNKSNNKSVTQSFKKEVISSITQDNKENKDNKNFNNNIKQPENKKDILSNIDKIIEDFNNDNNDKNEGINYRNVEESKTITSSVFSPITNTRLVPKNKSSKTNGITNYISVTSNNSKNNTNNLINRKTCNNGNNINNSNNANKCNSKAKNNTANLVNLALKTIVNNNHKKKTSVDYSNNKSSIVNEIMIQPNISEEQYHILIEKYNKDNSSKNNNNNSNFKRIKKASADLTNSSMNNEISYSNSNSNKIINAKTIKNNVSQMKNKISSVNNSNNNSNSNINSNYLKSESFSNKGNKKTTDYKIGGGNKQCNNININNIKNALCSNEDGENFMVHRNIKTEIIDCNDTNTSNEIFDMNHIMKNSSKNTSKKNTSNDNAELSIREKKLINTNSNTNQNKTSNKNITKINNTVFIPTNRKINNKNSIINSNSNCNSSNNALKLKKPILHITESNSNSNYNRNNNRNQLSFAHEHQSTMMTKNTMKNNKLRMSTSVINNNANTSYGASNINNNTPSNNKKKEKMIEVISEKLALKKLKSFLPKKENISIYDNTDSNFNSSNYNQTSNNNINNNTENNTNVTFNTNIETNDAINNCSEFFNKRKETTDTLLNDNNNNNNINNINTEYPTLKRTKKFKRCLIDAINTTLISDFRNNTLHKSRIRAISEHKYFKSNKSSNNNNNRNAEYSVFNAFQEMNLRYKKFIIDEVNNKNISLKFVDEENLRLDAEKITELEKNNDDYLEEFFNNNDNNTNNTNCINSINSLNNINNSNRLNHSVVRSNFTKRVVNTKASNCNTENDININSNFGLFKENINTNTNNKSSYKNKIINYSGSTRMKLLKDFENENDDVDLKMISNKIRPTQSFLLNSSKRKDHLENIYHTNNNDLRKSFNNSYNFNKVLSNNKSLFKEYNNNNNKDLKNKLNTSNKRNYSFNNHNSTLDKHNNSITNANSIRNNHLISKTKNQRFREVSAVYKSDIEYDSEDNADCNSKSRGKNYNSINNSNSSNNKNNNSFKFQGNSINSNSSRRVNSNSISKESKKNNIGYNHINEFSINMVKTDSSINNSNNSSNNNEYCSSYRKDSKKVANNWVKKLIPKGKIDIFSIILNNNESSNNDNNDNNNIKDTNTINSNVQRSISFKQENNEISNNITKINYNTIKARKMSENNSSTNNNPLMIKLKNSEKIITKPPSKKNISSSSAHINGNNLYHNKINEKSNNNNPQLSVISPRKINPTITNRTKTKIN